MRLRSEPKIVAAKPSSKVIGQLPDGHHVRLISGRRGDKFLEVEPSLNGPHLRGFAASQFLVPVADDVLRKTASITKRTARATALPLNEANQPGRVGTTPAELRAELAEIIDYLAVDKASHLRYQPSGGLTFCNIYAHDFCHLAGVYLPRVWWTPDAIERLTQGQAVEPRLGNTIDEQRAKVMVVPETVSIAPSATLLGLSRRRCEARPARANPGTRPVRRTGGTASSSPTALSGSTPEMPIHASPAFSTAHFCMVTSPPGC